MPTDNYYTRIVVNISGGDVEWQTPVEKIPEIGEEENFGELGLQVVESTHQTERPVNIKDYNIQ